MVKYGKVEETVTDTSVVGVGQGGVEWVVRWFGWRSTDLITPIPSSPSFLPAPFRDSVHLSFYVWR